MITDWTDAYDNRGHIPDAASYEPRWIGDAQAYRTEMFAQGRAEIDLAYGDRQRNRMDLFHPVGTPKGLVVFVHGGYWRVFDKSLWSHFAAGVVDAGWACAMPSYTLTPEVAIADITREVTAAIETVAQKVAGDIRLMGHSAGGHLVSRMICNDTTLSAAVTDRIVHTVSISGVHDLRPLVNIAFNEDFRLTTETAADESPVLKTPLAGARVTAWVGDDELPEFVRQTTLLSNIWSGLGADTAQFKESGKHHFTILDGLRRTDSALTETVLS